MAATEHEKTDVPAVLGGDLPEREQTALEEAHDIDSPAVKEDGVIRNREHQPLKQDVVVESEKTDKPDGSSNSSDDGVPADRDMEKGEPHTNVSEASKEPTDPNIVDWEGPDDPQNPMNWYEFLTRGVASLC